MVSQIITITQAGEVSGLQVKKGKGVDLRKLGKAHIVRASEIQWDEEAQGWTVVIQDAPGFEAVKGLAVSPRMAAKAGGRAVTELCDQITAGTAGGITDENAPILFTDYEDAVRFEIAYLDQWRLNGVFTEGAEKSVA